MANKITLNSAAYEGRYLQLVCTQTKNIANNTSTISWALSSVGGTHDYYSTGPTTVTINGVKVYSKSRVDYSTHSFPAARGSTSGTLTVNHNSDGSKSISISVSTAIYSSTTSTTSSTWTLDSNPRQAEITSAPNFTNEGNPTISYSNPAGANVSSLQACISITDGTDDADISYRDIPLNGNSYTFNLTDTERNTLISAVPKTSRTLPIKFFIKTVIGGVTYRKSVSRTFSLINGEPECNAVAMVDNTKDTITFPLTGSNQKYILNHSILTYNSGATPKFGADIVKYIVSCGSVAKNTSSGTIEKVNGNKLIITVVDSRGFSTTKTLDLDVVNYVDLKTSIKIEQGSASEGSVNYTITNKSFTGSFGARTNKVKTNLLYRVAGTTNWTVLSNITSLTGTITGLDYSKQYEFKSAASDLIYTTAVGSSIIKVSFSPIFYWNKSHFYMNQDIILGNDTKIAQAVRFKNPTNSTKQHHISLYGGSESDSTAFGIWDSKNGRGVMTYNDETNTINIGNSNSQINLSGNYSFNLPIQTTTASSVSVKKNSHVRLATLWLPIGKWLLIGNHEWDANVNYVYVDYFTTDTQKTDTINGKYRGNMLLGGGGSLVVLFDNNEKGRNIFYMTSQPSGDTSTSTVDAINIRFEAIRIA